MFLFLLTLPAAPSTCVRPLPSVALPISAPLAQSTAAHQIDASSVTAGDFTVQVDGLGTETVWTQARSPRRARALPRPAKAFPFLFQLSYPPLSLESKHRNPPTLFPIPLPLPPLAPAPF